ncbi:hybrid sensor histidine kinase/response regulator [Chloroflexus sp.]|uniref:hybrid sensor histidine kinase/response regulator n=1 Tax=Chloroflexus sp. TaxID=1904827 RepID=UPI0026266F6D|nr:ATP-binding protein [uncultured Chloroflexus sp.]
MAASSDPSMIFVGYAQKNLQHLLRFLVTLTILGVIAYTLLSPIDPSLIPQRLLIVVPLLGLLFFDLWLVHQQRLRLASLLLVAAIWLVSIVAATISGGVRAPAFAAMTIVVVLAGILLGHHATWLATALSIGTGALFTLFADHLPPPPLPHSALSWFIAYTIYLSLTAYTITQVMHHFHQSLQATDKELAERRQVEQQLRFSEEKFARVFDSAPFAMLIARLSDDLIVNANAACREFFELSSDQIIKQPVNALIQSQLPARWSVIKEMLQQQGAINGFEFSFQRRDGSLGFGQLAAEVVELTEELCALVALQDVTPLRRANERLAELAARQEQLASLAREALANSHLDTLFATAVEQTAQTLHLSGIELIEMDEEGPRIRASWGQTPAQPLPAELFRDVPDDHPGWNRLPAALADRIVPPARHGATMLIRGKDRLFGALLAYAPDPLDTEAVFFLSGVANVLAVAIERFYTEQERRQIETQMLQAQKLESLGLLAGGIAHDFNNLLTGIMGHTSLALLDLPPHHELQPHLTAIDQAAQRAAELCSQLLAYAGRGQRSLEPVDLSTLVREMGSILRLPANRNGQVTIAFELAADLPVVVVEATQIRQVVLNLLTNAIEAIGERSGTVTLRTSAVSLSAADMRRLQLVPAIPPGQYVTLTVSDTGVGMDEATLRQIFDPFFSTKPKGHGLGLAAVQGIVRRHHGAIRVDSLPGLGSTFTVYLPAVKSATIAGQPAPAPGLITLSGTALIVDDEDAVRTTVSRIFERAGMVTIEAGDGHTALSLLTESAINVDVALIDLAMPGMNGIELHAAIRRRLPRLPILLMSGNADHVILPSDPFTDFLAKPYRSRDLLEKVRSLMQRAAMSPTQHR